jgi:hypothetical protein
MPLLGKVGRPTFDGTKHPALQNARTVVLSELWRRNALKRLRD